MEEQALNKNKRYHGMWNTVCFAGKARIGEHEVMCIVLENPYKDRDKAPTYNLYTPFNLQATGLWLKPQYNNWGGKLAVDGQDYWVSLYNAKPSENPNDPQMDIKFDLAEAPVKERAPF